jgi:hypothetical protein
MKKSSSTYESAKTKYIDVKGVQIQYRIHRKRDTCHQGGEGISDLRNYVKCAENIEGAERYLYFFFKNSERGRSTSI